MPLTLTVMRTREAAAFLKLAESTLCKMRCYRGGPAYLKAGARIVVYDQADLERWLDSRKRVSTSDAGAAD
jgi:hypothetical protein